MRYRLVDYVLPGCAFHLARVEHPVTRRSCVHQHDFSEVFFIEKGQCIHRINGETQLLTPGDLVMIRPDDEHGFIAKQAPFTMVNLAFETSVIDHLHQRYFDAVNDWPGSGDTMPARWHMEPGQLDRLSGMTLELSMGRQNLLNLESFLLRLLAMVTEAQSEAVIAMNYPDWLKTAIRSFMEDGNWTGGVNALVQHSGKTTEHVNRTIRDITGLTTTELVNTLRLDRAAHMLRMTRQPIVNVAMDCGYENLGYFYRCFKKRFNITPRHYRLTAQAVAR